MSSDPSPPRTSPILKWLTVLFVAFLVLVIVLANYGALPAPVPLYRHIPYGDKVGHFLFMGTLCLLVNLTMRARRMRVFGVSVLAGSVIVAIIVTLEELTQLLLPRRSFEGIDLLADLAGILVGGQIARFLVARRAIGAAAASSDVRP